VLLEHQHESIHGSGCMLMLFITPWTAGGNVGGRRRQGGKGGRKGCARSQTAGRCHRPLRMGSELGRRWASSGIAFLGQGGLLALIGWWLEWSWRCRWEQSAAE
jgi:hypothetical protein